MTPLLLVHGAGLDSRVWRSLLPSLRAPATAVDLPGRGRRPDAPTSLRTYAEAVVEDVDAAAFNGVVVVAHSAAACILPAVVEMLGERLRHVAYVAAIVPRAGTSARESAPRPARHAGGDAMPELLGNDLDDDQLDAARSLLVPEHPTLTRAAVDTTSLEGVPGSWIRTMRDRVVPPERQLDDARRLGLGSDVVDLDAGHLCMLSRPAELAALLDGCAEHSARAAG